MDCKGVSRMKRPHVYIPLTIILFLSVLPTAHGQPLVVAVHSQHSNCVDRSVQDAEVLAHKQLDVNQDGVQDDVVIYGQGDLYILVAINQSSLGCKIVLNDYLTSSAGEKARVTVQRVELVNLTGDKLPELHVGVDSSSPTFRASKAFHAIYKLQGESMERVFVTSQCLRMSSFDFRPASDGIKLIYVDEDRRCVAPSYSRDYEIYRWNAEASQFEQIESGQVAKETPDTFWQSALSVLLEIAAVFIAGILFVGLVIVFVLKRNSPKQT
jgi:hypothetical protein